MSDDFGDSLEDAIQDRVGTLGLYGLLRSHRQRDSQMRAAEAQLKAIESHGRTEQQRLNIEKRRFELEQQRILAESERQEAVRALRAIMAEVGVSLESLLENEMLADDRDYEVNYHVAVLLVKLNIVQQRSDSLHDLDDLKEMNLLLVLGHRVVKEKYGGCDPRTQARDKWRELIHWLKEYEDLDRQLTHIGEGIPGVDHVGTVLGLGVIRAKMQLLTAWRAYLSKNAPELEKSFPAGVVRGEELHPELIEFAEIDAVLHDLPPPPRIPEPVSDLKNLDFITTWDYEAEKMFSWLRHWENLRLQHEEYLERANSLLVEGNYLSAAHTAFNLRDAPDQRALDVKINWQVRFDDLDYCVIDEVIELLESESGLKFLSKRKAKRLAASIRANNKSIRPDSQQFILLEKYDPTPVVTVEELGEDDTAEAIPPLAKALFFGFVLAWLLILAIMVFVR